MKIIVIGATGTIGQAIVKELGGRHTIISVGHSHGDIKVDIEDKHSIQQMYDAIGQFDALISATGKVPFGNFQEMTQENYLAGIKNKLMGQVNLVVMGMKTINDGGSFTLTSGILSRDPIRGSACAALVNGALDSFVCAAAIEMPRHVRINVVSPTVLAESMDMYRDYFHGYEPVSAERVALAYSKSVEGAQTGKVYTVGY